MKQLRFMGYNLLLCLLSGPALSSQIWPQASVNKGTGSRPIKLAEKLVPAFTVWQLRAGEATESQVSVEQLNPAGYWLMVYIDLRSKACQNMLTQIQTLTAPTVSATGETAPAKLDPAKLVFVALHASGAQLSQFQLNYPGMAAATWTHDSQNAAANALGVRGTPHFFGMHESLQRWQYAGTPADSELPSMLTTWVAMNTQPKNKLTRNKVSPPATGSGGKSSSSPVIPATPSTVAIAPGAHH